MNRQMRDLSHSWEEFPTTRKANTGAAQETSFSFLLFQMTAHVRMRLEQELLGLC